MQKQISNHIVTQTENDDSSIVNPEVLKAAIQEQSEEE
jgi:hypothetical protein